jgi:acetyl esterase
VVGRTYLERGQPVIVLVRWAHPGLRNVLIRRANGSLVVRPFRGLRTSPQPVDNPGEGQGPSLTP